MTANARGILIFSATMWIKTTTPTKRLTVPELDATVEFSDKGTAQVSEDVGELLIENYKTITQYNDE